MNKVEIEGKVLASWLTKDGFLIMKVAVVYEHTVGESKITMESVFRPILLDKKKILMVDVVAGDKVHVTGYLYDEKRISQGGNTHSTIKFIASDIEVVSFAK